MKKGDVFITTDGNTEVMQGHHAVSLPANKVFTFVEMDAYGNVWINIDGLDCMVIKGGGDARQLPYPIVKPSKIEEYGELISKIVKDMVDVFGVDVEIEANQFRTKFHLG